MHSGGGGTGCLIGDLSSGRLGCGARFRTATSCSLGRETGVLIGTKGALENGGRPELQTLISARRRWSNQQRGQLHCT